MPLVIFVLFLVAVAAYVWCFRAFLARGASGLALVLASILGLIAGFALAIPCTAPIYAIIWPHATDTREGGVGFFFILVVAPAFTILGATIGAFASGMLSKPR